MNEPDTLAVLPPVRMSLAVPISAREAFDLFTRDIGSWWPLDVYSVTRGERTSCAFEGEELVERGGDGSRHVWGRVLVWEPPEKVALTWHPGREAESAQRLELRFADDGDGCRVELEHSGWERLGERAASAREGHESGWRQVLGVAYRDAARARVRR